MHTMTSAQAEQFLAVCSSSILAETPGYVASFSSPLRGKRRFFKRYKRLLTDQLQPSTNSDKLSVPNYGERYRHGEPIAPGFVESTVHEVVSKRFCTKQQMQWSKERAHLLLQTRVRTLNGELSGIFKRWYPDLDMKTEEIPLAACPPGSPCSRCMRSSKLGFEVG
jgi:hypothetical protein